jgi:hypothetical protein
MSIVSTSSLVLCAARKLTASATTTAQLLVREARGSDRQGGCRPGSHRVRSVTMMDSQPGTIWGREPAMVLALVQAVIALVVAFGLKPRARSDRRDPRGHRGGPRADHSQPGESGVRDGYLRGTLPRTLTAREVDVLAAFVAAGGSVPAAGASVGVRLSTAKRHLADLRARSGLTTEQLIYRGRAEGWLVVPSLERT